MRDDQKKRRGRGDSAPSEEPFWSGIRDGAEPFPRERAAAAPGAVAASDYKTSQLSAQAEDALALALAGSTDSALCDLTVVAVTPIRGSSCLEVVVHPAEPTADLAWLEAKLKRAKGYLRGELAAAIHRKRTPELAFVVLPLDDGDQAWDESMEDGDDWEDRESGEDDDP